MTFPVGFCEEKGYISVTFLLKPFSFHKNHHKDFFKYNLFTIYSLHYKVFQ